MYFSITIKFTMVITDSDVVRKFIKYIWRTTVSWDLRETDSLKSLDERNIRAGT